MVLRTALDDLLDAMLPARCPGCGRRGALVCAACAATLAPAPLGPPPPPVEWWTACFAYEGVARELVARAKYRNERRFLVLVARELARAVERAPAPIDLVTWAPASAARIRAQGVDHGELLARAVARHRRRAGDAVPAADAGPARRPDSTPARAGSARVCGRSGRSPARPSSSSTTSRRPGGTLAAAARALRARRRAGRARGDDRPHAAARAGRGDGCVYSGHSNRYSGIEEFDREHVDVVVFGKHVEVDPALRAITLEKLERIGKYANDVRRIDVDYGEHQTRQAGDSCTCEILVHLTHHLVKGTAAAVEHVMALDLALDKVEHQMRRLHERRVRRGNRARRDARSTARRTALADDEASTVRRSRRSTSTTTPARRS